MSQNEDVSFSDLKLNSWLVKQCATIGKTSNINNSANLK